MIALGLSNYLSTRAQGFRNAVEMLPVLRMMLFQLGSEKRAVRLLGVFVSNLRIARGRHQISSVTALSLWEEN